MVVSKSGVNNHSANNSALIKGGDPLIPSDFGMTVEEALGYAELENVSKATLVRIEVSQLPKEIPDFQAPGATKDTLIAEWLKNWLKARKRYREPSASQERRNCRLLGRQRGHGSKCHPLY
jgi:hypothetical protein